MILQKITVEVPNSYNIIFEKSFEPLVAFIAKEKYSKIAIVTDKNVNKHYGVSLENALKDYDVKKIVLPSGEKIKTLESAEILYNKFTEFRLTRADVVISLGGGVVGDLTGFCASTFLRGIPFIQVPTSLLAQVDSSIGGKVAVNTAEGKNLIGSFYQPKFVLINTDFLKTLPKRNLSDGMAELIKHAAIMDDELWVSIKSDNFDLASAIFVSCSIKAHIVSNDEFDISTRMLLNFGHTIGHAVETHHKYRKYTHGEAVAIGMYNISLVGEKLGVTTGGTAKRMRLMLEKFHLPTKLDIPRKKLLKIMETDKKTFGEQINMVFLNEIGRAEIKGISISELPSLFGV